MNILKSIWSFLDGKKVYIGTAALFCIGGLLYLGIIDAKTAAALAMIVSALTGAAMRSAIG